MLTLSEMSQDFRLVKGIKLKGHHSVSVVYIIPNNDKYQNLPKTRNRKILGLLIGFLYPYMLMTSRSNNRQSMR